jgi:hypothetical protein
MGFYDFLVPKGKPAEPDRVVPEAPGCSSTQIVRGLLEVPKADRDALWQQRFLQHVADAAFLCAEPRILQGSDQCPYFVLLSSPDGLGYPAHVIHHLLEDFLLDQGLGVVINPDGQDADWAFTFGDLVNYGLHGVFYPSQSYLAPPGGGVEGAPVAELPPPIRASLRTYLQSMGVAEPGFLVASRDRSGLGSLELVFNFSPKEFRSMEDFGTTMNRISWYFPRNYSYSVAGNEARTAPGFQPL